MADRDEKRVLTDAQWRRLSPLIEACRPPHKTEHHDLRRTIEAIVWRHRNGATWRSIPAALGPWWVGGTAPYAPTLGVAMASRPVELARSASATSLAEAMAQDGGCTE